MSAQQLAFNRIFRRERINAVLVEGDSFHRFDRAEMKLKMADASARGDHDPKGIDFPYLLSMIHDSFMSRPNIIVAPGGKMELAMQLILTPMILKMMDVRRRAIGAQTIRGVSA